jgi:hypothetical protein
VEYWDGQNRSPTRIVGIGLESAANQSRALASCPERRMSRELAARLLDCARLSLIFRASLCRGELRMRAVVWRASMSAYYGPDPPETGTRFNRGSTPPLIQARTSRARPVRRTAFRLAPATRWGTCPPGAVGSAQHSRWTTERFAHTAAGRATTPTTSTSIRAPRLLAPVRDSSERGSRPGIWDCSRSSAGAAASSSSAGTERCCGASTSLQIVVGEPQVLGQFSFERPHSGTLEVRVVSAGKRVVVDGLAVSTAT